MWKLILGALVILVITALILEAYRHDRTGKFGDKQKHFLERYKLINRWHSGDHLPSDEERMFEELYEGDVDDPTWE